MKNPCDRLLHLVAAAPALPVMMLTLTLAVGMSSGIIETLSAQEVSDPRVADLVQAGKIRVGVGSSVLGAIKDPASGELRGVAIDLARALADRLRVKLLPVEYPSPPRVLDGLKDGAWDVGIFAFDKSRLGQVDFSPPYLQVDSTFLVPPNSSIRTLADVDQRGIRITGARNGVEEIALKHLLKQAEFRFETTTPEGFKLLRAGNADVLASSRPTLLKLSAQWPGSRVLDDHFGRIEVAMAVPKSHAARLAYISEFIEEAKTSGFVQRAIERAGLVGFQVSPPGKPWAQ